MAKRGLGNAKLGRGEGSVSGDSLVNELITAGMGEVLEEIDVDRIDPNPWQPRHLFSEQDLDALAQDVQQNGLLHPVVVRRAGNRFELAVGERRLRAARSLGWRRIPARITVLADLQMRLVAFSENYAREQLSPWEEAIAIQGIQQGLEADGKPADQRAVASAVGLSLGTVNHRLQIGNALPLELVRAVEHQITEAKITGDDAERVEAAPSVHSLTVAQLLTIASVNDIEGRRLALLELLLPAGQEERQPVHKIKTNIKLPLRPGSRVDQEKARQMLNEAAPALEGLRRIAADDRIRWVIPNALGAIAFLRHATSMSPEEADAALEELEPHLDALRERAGRDR